MDWQTQRGITQLIIGAGCLCFALSMAVRCWRQDGFGWPLPWRLLVASWIAGIGASYLLHAWYWIEDGQDNLGRRIYVWPLWLLAGLTIWTFWRWLRDETGEPHP